MCIEVATLLWAQSQETFAQRGFIIHNLKFIILLAPGKPPRFPLYLPAGKGRSPIAIGGCSRHFGTIAGAGHCTVVILGHYSELGVGGKKEHFRTIAHGLHPRFELNSGGKSARSGFTTPCCHFDDRRNPIPFFTLQLKNKFKVMPDSCYGSVQI